VLFAVLVRIVGMLPVAVIDAAPAVSDTAPLAAAAASAAPLPPSAAAWSPSAEQEKGQEAAWEREKWSWRGLVGFLGLMEYYLLQHLLLHLLQECVLLLFQLSILIRILLGLGRGGEEAVGSSRGRQGDKS
jgi:hypothetical protein